MVNFFNQTGIKRIISDRLANIQMEELGQTTGSKFFKYVFLSPVSVTSTPVSDPGFIWEALCDLVGCGRGNTFLLTYFIDETYWLSDVSQ